MEQSRPSDTGLTPATITAFLSWCIAGFYILNPLAALVLLFACTAGAVFWATGQDQIPKAAVAFPAALVVWMAVSIAWSPAVAGLKEDAVRILAA